MLTDSASPFIEYFSEKKIPGFSGICYQCSFCTHAYSDLNVRYFLGEDLNEFLAQSMLKRKSEFIAGRYLARMALIALGANKATVGMGANRAPLWPNSFVGSISHTKEFAICAVAKQEDIKRLGIDIESFLDVKVAKNIVSSVLVEAEHEFVGTSAIFLTLVFSAKESLYKALYPEVGYFFCFKAAKMKAVNFQTGKFVIELLQELTTVLTIGTCFEGHFELSNNKVLTVIAC